MMIGALLVTVMLLRLRIVSNPQLVDCVISPVQSEAGTGVPARYMVEPLTRAMLPAAGLFCAQVTGLEPGLGTQEGTEVIRVSLTRLYCCTLAWVPPHSAPQLTMKAVLSSLLKKAATGRSKMPGPPM